MIQIQLNLPENAFSALRSTPDFKPHLKNSQRKLVVVKRWVAIVLAGEE
jgi:hypothetical protein